MDDLLLAVTAQNGGYLMRHELLSLGFTDKGIRRAVQSGLLVRVRHGTYVPTTIWRTSSPSQQHAIVVRSLLDKLGGAVVASHQSAAALHQLDLYGTNVSEVHLTRVDGLSGRAEAGVVYHEGRLTEDEIEVIDGCLCTTLPRTVIETSCGVSIESGLVLASSALRSGSVDPEFLQELVDQHATWPGMRTARMAMRLADGRLETVGEARSLYMMWRHGVPAPELQVEICDQHGVIGRCDFCWSAYRHIGEFDGMSKYGRLNPFSDEPGRQIEREKVREDRMRATQRGMTRWIYVELEDRRSRHTAERILKDQERSRRLYLRNATHIA